MNIFTILLMIFTAFFTASAVLEITAYNKKIKLLEHIAKPGIYVFLLLTSLMILIPRIPDSINIIIFLSIALITGLAGSTLQFFPKTKKNLILILSLFMTGFLCHLLLIAPSFRLFRAHPAVAITFLLIYAATLFFYYKYCIGKRNHIKTACIIVYLAPLLFLHYGTVITLCGQPHLYSALLFTGATVSIASQGLIIRGFFSKTSEKERLLRMILYIAGQFFVTAGYTLMVSF